MVDGGARRIGRGSKRCRFGSSASSTTRRRSRTSSPGIRRSPRSSTWPADRPRPRASRQIPQERIRRTRQIRADWRGEGCAGLHRPPEALLSSRQYRRRAQLRDPSELDNSWSAQCRAAGGRKHLAGLRAAVDRKSNGRHHSRHLPGARGRLNATTTQNAVRRPGSLTCQVHRMELIRPVSRRSLWRSRAPSRRRYGTKSSPLMAS